jgi:BirA family biotin operon repressor/biotin-[acetyl-CoA-carboxylase] ligase
LNKLQPKTLFTGKYSIYLPTCHSTNESAAEIIQKNEIQEGTIVITDNQTKGKGQRGNIWLSEANKNLTFTLILKPIFLDVSEQFKLNIAVSLGIYNGLKMYLGDELSIKWPNDIFYGDKKLGGMLIESMIANSQMRYSFVGIGLNINQTEFNLANATSLSKIANLKHFELNKVLEKICKSIEKEYLILKAGNEELQKDIYVNSLYRYDSWHLYRNENGEFDGRIIGVKPSGKLIMETKLGLKQFETKEFEYIY